MYKPLNVWRNESVAMTFECYLGLEKRSPHLILELVFEHVQAFLCGSGMQNLLGRNGKIFKTNYFLLTVEK